MINQVLDFLLENVVERCTLGVAWAVSMCLDVMCDPLIIQSEHVHGVEPRIVGNDAGCGRSNGCICVRIFGEPAAD